MRPVSLSTTKKHVRPRCKNAVPIPIPIRRSYMSDDSEYASRRYGARKNNSLQVSRNDPQWPTLSAEALRDALNREKSPFATDAELRLLVDRLFTDQSKLYNLGNLNAVVVAKAAREMFASGQIGLSAPARAAYQD